MGNLPQVKNTTLKRLSQRRRDAQLTKSLKESSENIFSKCCTLAEKYKSNLWIQKSRSVLHTQILSF